MAHNNTIDLKCKATLNSFSYRVIRLCDIGILTLENYMRNARCISLPLFNWVTLSYHNIQACIQIKEEKDNIAESVVKQVAVDRDKRAEFELYVPENV